MKKDIESRADIELMVNSFYSKVQQDEMIGPVFNEVANVDWDNHLPKMYEFFETIVLGTKGFKGNTMETHFQLNQKFPLKQEHFERWKTLLFNTLDGHFEGPVTEEAKQKARSIADLMLFKITSSGIRGTAKKR